MPAEQGVGAVVGGYGPRLSGVIRDAIRMVDKILRGARPSDILVEHPTQSEFVINRKTAKTLGLHILASVLHAPTRSSSDGGHFYNKKRDLLGVSRVGSRLF
jgi:hypothetical protein